MRTLLAALIFNVALADANAQNELLQGNTRLPNCLLQ